jgi:hypothetical protein
LVRDAQDAWGISTLGLPFGSLNSETRGLAVCDSRPTDPSAPLGATLAEHRANGIARCRASQSRTVGGQNVAGYMKTALANNKGQLVIPALLTGTFSHPHFAPDVQQLAQMKLKGLVLNLKNPSAVAGALQNLLGGAKAPAGSAAGSAAATAAGATTAAAKSATAVARSLQKDKAESATAPITHK